MRDTRFASAPATLFLAGTHLQLWFARKLCKLLSLVVGSELTATNFMLQRPEWHIREDLPRLHLPV